MPQGLNSCPALVLNADYRPLSYFPLSVWPWQEAVKAVVADKVSVLECYNLTVRSPSFRLPLPSVIALRDYVKVSKRPAFTRFNVFLRDCFRCQYCGKRFPAHELTFDHVVPRSKGGRTTWFNVVASCSCCNLTKGNQLPSHCKMHPLKEPHEPSTFELQQNGRSFPPNYLHESWGDYLYWDSELEP